MKENTKFKENNEFWKLRTKHGKPPLFSPEELKLAIEEYFEMTNVRTWNEQHWVGKDGDQVIKYHPVPFTITGLYLFLGVCKQTWHNYKKNVDYVDVTTHAENIIYTQKFEGAATGFFKESIISKDLGLTDKREVTVKEEQPLFPEEDDVQTNDSDK